MGAAHGVGRVPPRTASPDACDEGGRGYRSRVPRVRRLRPLARGFHRSLGLQRRAWPGPGRRWRLRRWVTCTPGSGSCDALKRRRAHGPVGASGRSAPRHLRRVLGKASREGGGDGCGAVSIGATCGAGEVVPVPVNDDGMGQLGNRSRSPYCRRGEVSCTWRIISKLNINLFQAVNSPLVEPVSMRRPSGVH